jgi:hypothetical protein
LEPAVVSAVPAESRTRAGRVGGAGRASRSGIPCRRGAEDDGSGIRAVCGVWRDAASGVGRRAMSRLLERRLSTHRRVRAVRRLVMPDQRNLPKSAGSSSPGAEWISQLARQSRSGGGMQQKRVALAFVLGVSAGVIAGCGGGAPGEQKPSTMPPEVAAEMQKRLGSTTGPVDVNKTGASPSATPK